MKKCLRTILPIFMMLGFCLIFPSTTEASSHNASVTSTQPGNLVVEWDGDDAVDHFTVRYTIGQNGSAQQSNVASYERRFVITNIGPATRFSIEVSEYDGGVVAWTSQTMTGFTTGEPPVAKNATVTTGEQSVHIKWDRVDEVKDYRVTLKDAQGTVCFSDYMSNDVSIDYTAFNGTVGKSYSYTIQSRAYNDVMSSQSLSGSFQVPVIKPSAPEKVKVVKSDEKSVTLEWDAVEGVDGYSVNRSDVSETGVVSKDSVEVGVVGALVTTYTDKTVVEGKTYAYTIIAFNKAGNSDPSKPVLVTVGPTNRPTPPTNLRAENITDVSFDLVWDPCPDASGYRVYLSSKADGSFQLLGETQATFYPVTKLTKGVTVFLKVEAFNVIGASNPSAVIEVTTGAGDGKLSLFAGKVSDKAVTLTWTTNEPADAFYVYRSDMRGSGYEKVAEVDGSKRQWTDKNVQAGRKYYYKVAIVTNQSGEGEMSDVLEVMTRDEGDGQLLMLILLLATVLVLVGGGTVLLYLYRTGRLGKKKKSQSRRPQFETTAPLIKEEEIMQLRVPQSSRTRESQMPKPAPPAHPYPQAPVEQPVVPHQEMRLPMPSETEAIGNTAAWNWFIGDEKPESVMEMTRWPTEPSGDLNNDQGDPLAWTAYSIPGREGFQQPRMPEQPQPVIPAADTQEMPGGNALQQQADKKHSTGQQYRKCPHCMTANPIFSEKCEICGAVF